MKSKADESFWATLRGTLREEDLRALEKLTERYPDEPVRDLFYRVFPELKGIERVCLACGSRVRGNGDMECYGVEYPEIYSGRSPERFPVMRRGRQGCDRQTGIRKRQRAKEHRWSCRKYM